MARTAYRRAKTTARDLGNFHQLTRQQALKALKDGDPCWRCELHGVYHPMWRAAVSVSPKTGKLVAPLLDLDDYPGRAFGGPQVKKLSWRHCNRSHGARLGNLMRAAQRPARYTRW